MKNRLLFLHVALALGLAACRGSVPIAGEEPQQGLAAVVIGAQFAAAGSPTNDGKTAVALKSADGRTYRLYLSAGQTVLYQMDPGLYRLAPVPEPFGAPGRFLHARIDGRDYQTPFPQEFVNSQPINAKAGRIAVLGLLKIKLSAPLPGRGPFLSADLANFAEDKRALVQNLISRMMDPTAPASVRQNALAWLNPLEKALMSLAAQPQTPIDQTP